MRAAHAAYRALICLYPRDFRERYRADLEQSFADLVDDRGVRAAWARSALDLTITIPRYRLESLMTERQSSATVSVVVVLLATLGAISVPFGFYPGIALLIAAAALAFVQRSALARAIRIADSSRRRRRLTTAGLLALSCTAVTTVFLFDALGDDHWGTKVVVYNAIFLVMLAGTIAYLIAGLLTPKSDDDSGVATAA